NLKPCYMPAPDDVYAKGLTSNIQLAELMQAKAYCLSAQGKQTECLDTLLNGLTFVRRSSGINMMAFLCDVLGERKLFDAFLEQLPKMSLADTQKLIAYVDEAVKEPPMAGALIQRSQKVHEIMLRKAKAAEVVLQNPKDYPKLQPGLAGMTEGERS